MSLTLGVSFILIKKSMKCINNPPLLTGLCGIGVDFVMAWAAGCRKKLMETKPLANPSGLVVDVCRLGLLASLAHWVESQVGVANLCILFVFTLALGGCIPQPTFTLEWGAAFQR